MLKYEKNPFKSIFLLKSKNKNIKKTDQIYIKASALVKYISAKIAQIKIDFMKFGSFEKVRIL